jgi:hypothetical protein
MGSTCTQMGTACTQMGNTCTQMGTTFTQMGTACTQMGTACTQMGTACTQMGTACTQMGTACTQMGTTCTQINTSYLQLLLTLSGCSTQIIPPTPKKNIYNISDIHFYSFLYSMRPSSLHNIVVRMKILLRFLEYFLLNCMRNCC